MTRKILQGVVVSDKRSKTVTVRVERKKRHPLYGKIVRTHHNFSARDGREVFKEGDVVSIEECKPYSKTVSWRVCYSEQARSAS